MMRLDLTKTTRVLLLLALAASSAGGQVAPQLACPFDAGFLGLRDRCDAGEDGLTAADCATVRVFELLARDQREAAVEILERELGYPEASRELIQPWLELLAKIALDSEGPPECTQAQAQSVFALGGATSGVVPEVLAFLGRTLGWSEVLMSRFEERRADPATATASQALGQASRKILLSIETGKMVLNSLTSNPLAQMVCGQTPTPLPAPAEGGDEARRQIDVALRFAHEKGLDHARETVARARSLATDPVHEATLLARAGVGFLVGEFNEAALGYLRQADDLLAEHDGETTTATELLRVLTRYFLADAYRQGGFAAEAARTAASAEILADGDMGKVMKAVGESFLRRDFEASALLAGKLDSGELDKDQLEPLLDVLGDVVPGLDFDLWNRLGASVVEGSCFGEVFRLVELLSLDFFDEAAGVAEGLIARYPSYNSVYLLTLIAGKQFLAKDHDGALRNSHKAIDALEARIDTFRVGETLTSAIDDKVYLIFRAAVEMAGQAGQKEEAFDLAERGRAWTLRLLGSSWKASGRSEPSDEEKETLAAIHELENDLRSAAPDRQETLESELAARRSSFVVQRLARTLGDEGERSLARVESATLDRFRTEVLPPHTTLLVYAEGSGDLWAWVIDRDSVEMVFLPLPEDQRVAEVTDAVRGMSRRGIRPLVSPSNDSLKALYSHLIAPLAGHLDQKNLIVVPHGVLHHLPFAALRDPKSGEYLVERFTLSLAPSASVLSQILLSDRHSSVGEPLVLGDPAVEVEGRELLPLPRARREALAVAGLLSTEPLLREQATKIAVLDQAEHIGLLHLAAHGELSSSDPIFSWIRLSTEGENRGLVEMHEVWDHWSLPKARLVTLSGCQTALGELTRGDEVLGLTQAFLVAGSRAVLSTLWSATDDPSEELMVAFYRQLLAGKTAASALRHAQLKLKQNPRYDDPFYWAGYTLTGDPQTRLQVAPAPTREDTPQAGGSAFPMERASEPRRRLAVLKTVLGLLFVAAVVLSLLHTIGPASRFFHTARIYIADICGQVLRAIRK